MLYEQCEEKIRIIKLMTIATIIMEITRKLPDEDKALVR